MSNFCILSKSLSREVSKKRISSAKKSTTTSFDFVQPCIPIARKLFAGYYRFERYLRNGIRSNDSWRSPRTETRETIEPPLALSLSPPRHGFFSRAQKNSRNVVVDRRPLSGRAASEPHGRKLFETEKLDIRCASWPRGFSFREREATGAGGNERREERANWKREGYMIYGRRNRIFVRL